MGGRSRDCEKKCHRGKVSRLRPSLTWQCNSSPLPRHANDDGSAPAQDAVKGKAFRCVALRCVVKSAGEKPRKSGGMPLNAECVCKYLLNVFMCKQLRVHLCDFRVAWHNNDVVDEDDVATQR